MAFQWEEMELALASFNDFDILSRILATLGGCTKDKFGTPGYFLCHRTNTRRMDLESRIMFPCNITRDTEHILVFRINLLSILPLDQAIGGRGGGGGGGAQPNNGPG